MKKNRATQERLRKESGGGEERKIPDLLIELKNVKFSYSDEGGYAVDDVSLCVRRGEYLAVVGHNGSGKSTLAKLMNRLYSAESGEVRLCGVEINENTPQEEVFFVRKNVGMVFQNPDNQMVASIVEDDVAFGPENLGLKREDIIERVAFALNSVGMYDYRLRTPNRLSGGQKQRISIAGVLALSPEILVLDEATSMLDPSGRDEILAIAGRLCREEGKTVIHITHFMDEIFAADRVIAMKKGKIAFEGAPAELFKHPDAVAECGLELPRVIRLTKMLSDAGIELPDGIFTAEGLGNALVTALRGE